MMLFVVVDDQSKSCMQRLPVRSTGGDCAYCRPRHPQQVYCLLGAEMYQVFDTYLIRIVTLYQRIDYETRSGSASTQNNNLQSVALPVPEIIATAVLGWGCEPPILGKGRP